MTKQETREFISAKKKALSENEIKLLSEQLTKKFISSDFWKNASVIYAYMSYNQEVRTNPIIEAAWKDNKKVAIPKTYDKSYMEFCYIDSFREVMPGYCSIPEPVTDKVANEKNVLILMPGLGFDRECNRIGYGGGFYDKYLSSHKNTTFTKVALGFDFQLLDQLDVEAHDEKMDIVITPSETIFLK